VKDDFEVHVFNCFHFFRFHEEIDFEGFVGTCFAESFEADSFDSDEALQRDKRSFDAQLLGKAETLSDFSEVVRLYHAAQVQMTDKLVNEVRKLNRDMTLKLDPLNDKVDVAVVQVNETRVEQQKFYLSDFWLCFYGWYTDQDLTHGKTFSHIVKESSPWTGVFTLLVGFFGWCDARIGSALAKWFGFKLSPYNKVYNNFLFKTLNEK
jgi:hypothetical protein